MPFSQHHLHTRLGNYPFVGRSPHLATLKKKLVLGRDRIVTQAINELKLTYAAELSTTLEILEKNGTNGAHQAMQSAPQPSSPSAKADPSAVLQRANNYFLGHGLSAGVASVRSAVLAGLPEDLFAVLSEEVIFTALLAQVARQSGAPKAALEDKAAFRANLLSLAVTEGGALQLFYEKVVDGVQSHLSFQPDEAMKKALVKSFRDTPPPLAAGALVPAVQERRQTISRTHAVRKAVDDYANKNEIEAHRFTEEVRRRMVDFLTDSGVVKTGDDEYLALAYNHAISALKETVSPTSGGWDFSIDAFEPVQDITVDPDNILAVGFLDYAYELGERLSVFDMIVALYLEWSKGTLDLEQGPLASKLERFWQDQDSFETPEERAMAYAKALGKGDTNVLDGMRVNRDFQRLWTTLLDEVARFVDKRERAISNGDSSPVSRVPIYEATRQLQRNLTDYGNGRTKSQASQLRNRLKTCLEILDAPEILDAYGTASRRDRWRVIAALHGLMFGANGVDVLPNIEAVRNRAREGNRIFQWIADFNEATTTPEEMDALLLPAAEAYRLNMETPMDGIHDGELLSDEELDAEVDSDEDEDDVEFFDDEFDA